MRRPRTRVAVCAYAVDKNDVSEAQMAFEWISRLAESVDTVVFTSGSRRGGPCGLEGHSGVELHVLPTKISFKRWDAFDRFAHPSYVEFYFRARHTARAVARRSRVDLAHHLAPQSLRYPTPLMGLKAPLILGPFHGGLPAPRVLSELEGKESAFFQLRKLDPIRMRVDPLLRRQFARANRIAISAPYMMHQLRQFAHKCSIVPGTAMDPPCLAAKMGRQDGAVRLIFVGKLEPSKGMELLLSALKLLESYAWTLDVFGVGPGGRVYEQMCEQLGLADRVKWHGFVKRPIVLEAYGRSDVFVFPSVKEPTGGALLEAMAAGLPVVCVDSGGPAFAVDSTCGMKISLGTKAEMTDDLSKAIGSLLADASIRRSMGDAARARFHSTFTWDQVVEEMLRLYSDVLQDAKISRAGALNGGSVGASLNG